MRISNILMAAAETGAGGGSQTLEQLQAENLQLRAWLKEREDLLRKAGDRIEQLEAGKDTETVKLERRIQQKISESGGALNRDQALISIGDQDAHAARLEKAKAVKKK
jgi:hypothetical protein